MQVIAITANRILTSVRQKIARSSKGPTPSRIPATMAAMKQPVPVAESQFRSYLAASGVGFETTGSALLIALCSIGQSHPAGPFLNVPSGIFTSKLGVVARFIAALIGTRPQSKTKRESI